jgi:hypothetical protein
VLTSDPYPTLTRRGCGPRLQETLHATDPIQEA